VRGSGSVTLRLERTPLAEISDISVATESMDLAGAKVRIADPEFGVITRSTIWDTGTQYDVTYRAGYFLPGADFFSALVDVAGTTTNTFTLNGAAVWPEHVVSAPSATEVAVGDNLATGLFDNVSNNGLHSVTDQTGLILTVAEPLVTEAQDEVRWFGWRTLPQAIERATLVLVQEAYHQRDRDPSLSILSLQGNRFEFSKESLDKVNNLLLPFAAPGSPVLKDVGSGAWVAS
jgi:hypothetical protein